MLAIPVVIVIGIPFQETKHSGLQKVSSVPWVTHWTVSSYFFLFLLLLFHLLFLLSFPIFFLSFPFFLPRLISVHFYIKQIFQSLQPSYPGNSFYHIRAIRRRESVRQTRFRQTELSLQLVPVYAIHSDNWKILERWALAFDNRLHATIAAAGCDLIKRR